jgi:hypothetical protein
MGHRGRVRCSDAHSSGQRRKQQLVLSAENLLITRQPLQLGLLKAS